MLNDDIDEVLIPGERLVVERLDERLLVIVELEVEVERDDNDAHIQGIGLLLQGDDELEKCDIEVDEDEVLGIILVIIEIEWIDEEIDDGDVQSDEMVRIVEDEVDERDAAVFVSDVVLNE